jgi:FlaA1/EpsC-like NDP-sugar epimerase
MTMSKTKARLLRLLERIQTIERVPRLVVWLVQLSIFVFSGLAAFLIRFEFTIPAVHIQHLVWALPIWLIAKAIVFRLCGLDRGWWRFVSIHDIFRLGAGNVIGSLASAGLILTLVPPGFPRSIYLLDLLICLLATTGVRVLTRIVQDSLLNGRETAGDKAVLIYGAGAAGVTLLREIRSNAALHYKVLGFLDDNPQKRGIVIQGVKVLGSGNALATLLLKHKVEEVLIALPSATGQEMTTILTRCHQAGVRCRTIPALAEMIEGRALANQIRDVAVEDLLGRTPVRLDEDRIRARLEGKTVLVTGAAGSIGTELCRQIANFRPARVVGFEIAETPLFYLEREMRARFSLVPFTAEIGSIQNSARLQEVFAAYKPDVVYHAAAYKHVPMMEAHVFEALENNVLGTRNVAVAAIDSGASDFVLISSDKAVRPTSIMGATKRVAELLILALQAGSNGAAGVAGRRPDRDGPGWGTKFVCVRFGNVLGSSGSVIPIFKQQIAAGGPVTVTHREMRRYFMTIPEAAQLVIQAASMGEGGEIFVLDMGEAVKIVDLARNLILLSGLRPDEDIKIEFSGVRPGEKLYEEVAALTEDTAPTYHEKIRIFTGGTMTAETVEEILTQLREVNRVRNTAELVMVLKEILPDYSPSAHLLRRVIDTRAKYAVAGK